MNQLRIAVLLPCYNEQGAIGKTVADFSRALPGACVYVYDNNSVDGSVREAEEAGAIVRHEPRQGKGEVVRRMFADIEADVYVLADADDTYEAEAAPEMIRTLVDERLDMITGTRSTEACAYPSGHVLGNRAFSQLISTFFGAELKDVFSGYRVMSRRFVKSLPVLSHGFEIETELSVFALMHRLPAREIATMYRARPEGTVSKLHTFKDGFKILNFILFLLRDVKPLQFFSTLAALLAILSLSLGIPVILEFWETGLVARFPTAILSSATGVLSGLCLFSGFILDNVSRARLEAKMLAYLAQPALPGSDDAPATQGRDKQEC